MPYYPGVLRWGTYVIWISFALLNKKYLKKFIYHCWPLLSICAYMLLISLFNGEEYVLEYFKNFSYLIMIYSIFLYYFSDDKFIKFRKKIVVFLLFDFLFVAIRTYIHLQQNPLIARQLLTSDRTKEIFSVAEINGIGGFAFFYALVPFTLFLFYLIINKHRHRFLLLLLSLFLTLVILKASFTISILLLFTFISLFVIIRNMSKLLYVFVFPTSFLLVLLTLNGTISNLFYRLSYLDFISTEISIRLVELSHFFSGNNLMGTDLKLRLTLYTDSLNTFINNFFTGTIIPINQDMRVGGHSAWLDLMAHTGIVSILLFVFLFKAYKYMIKRTSKEFNTFVRSYWLYFLFVGLVNTLFFSTIFTVWFLFIPFFISALTNNKIQAP